MAAEELEMQVSPTSMFAASSSRPSTATVSEYPETKVPFEKSKELCKDLQYTHEIEKSPTLRSRCPNQTLPDAPRIRVDRSSEMLTYCLDDLDTPHLNALGEKLWRAGPTPDVVSLTQHAVLDRKIQITEDPSVHLLWVEGILFVKPLPAYLTSYAFWAYLTDATTRDIGSGERERLIATSLGFLKTYAHLIRRRSDFNLARRHELLGVTSFEDFITFIACFDELPTSAVSSRWRYGLIQLDALNFHSILLTRRWHLNRFESRYSTYFSRFFPVVLFIFALFSVMLSAMQVIIAARQIWDTDNKGLKRVLELFTWFGTEAIAWGLLFALLFVVWWIGVSVNEQLNRRKAKMRTQKQVRDEGACS
jgi:hypothetical protein